MNNIKYIDLALISTLFTLLLVFYFTSPVKAQEAQDCTEYCESLCGEATTRVCQYTYCNNEPKTCMGKWIPENN